MQDLNWCQPNWLAQLVFALAVLAGTDAVEQCWCGAVLLELVLAQLLLAQ